MPLRFFQPGQHQISQDPNDKRREETVKHNKVRRGPAQLQRKKGQSEMHSDDAQLGQQQQITGGFGKGVAIIDPVSGLAARRIDQGRQNGRGVNR